MHTLRKNKNNTKKRVLIVVAVLAVAGAVGGFFVWKNHQKLDTYSEPPAKYVSRTEDEKKAAEDQKEKIVEDQKSTIVSDANNQNGQDSGTKAVKPIITNASSSSINAYVTGVFEEGGICTATFTSGSTTRTKTSEGFGNASYTQCAPIAIENGLLSAGDWSVTVSYSSSKAQGTSDPRTIKVN